MHQIQKNGYIIELYGIDDKITHHDIKPPYPGYLSVTQTHSTDIYMVKESDTAGKYTEEADAIVCIGRKLYGIGTYVADCTPLVLMGDDIYAVVHLSWKTLRDGLLEKVLGLGHIYTHAYIGPSLRVENFEVGGEFLTYFDQKYLPQYGDRYHLDIVQCIVDILHDYSIHDVDIHPDETLSSDLWWSYRGGAQKKRNFVGVKAI